MEAMEAMLEEMFWERIVIENCSTIVLERDVVRGVICWSVSTCGRSAAGEAETAAEAMKQAFAAANAQQKKIQDEATREWQVFDHFDR